MLNWWYSTYSDSWTLRVLNCSLHNAYNVFISHVLISNLPAEVTQSHFGPPSDLRSISTPCIAWPVLCCDAHLAQDPDTAVRYIYSAAHLKSPLSDVKKAKYVMISALLKVF